jgi:hypothetical protein
MLPRKIAIAVAVTAALGAGVANAAEVSQSLYTFSPTGANGNFTMLSPTSYGTPGYAFGGTNDVTFTWTGTFFNSSSDYTGSASTSNATIASPTLFFGKKWTAHTVQIFGPGSYSFDTAVANGGANIEAGTQSMTVGAGQIGAHMLFDWNNNISIDVVNVWNINGTFSGCDTPTAAPTAHNCLWSGTLNSVGNSASTVFSVHSTDNDGDTTLGVPMAPGGPFAGNNANFNLQGVALAESAVPVPAAVWLFGSGLLGLVGIARRKKKA